MISIHFRSAAAVAALVAGLSCGTALAQQVPLRAGSYRCFTLTAMPNGPAINPRDPNWRRSQGLPELERGQRATPPLQVPGISIIPAFFGNIAVDGKGGYRLTASGKGGRYGFDAAAGVPTFTGDLAIMKVQRYDGRAGRFFLAYQSLAYECGLEGRGPPAAAATPPPIPKSNRIGKVSDYSGRFIGRYVCNQQDHSLQLDTKASQSGLLVAVYSFGGSGGEPKGVFTLVGKWTPNGFSLAQNEWVDQPKPSYQMVDLSGVLTAQGLSGRVIHPSCSTFELRRE